MKYNSPSAEKSSIKHKLVKWAHVPVDLHINNDTTKKRNATFLFDNYSEEDVIQFLEEYIVSSVGNNFYGIQLKGIRQGELTKVLFSDIYYFEAIQSRLYAYTQESAYLIKCKLYEIEDFNPIFIRINKSTVINILFVGKVRPLINSKLQIELLDGQDLEVNRKYRKKFLNYLEEY
ncbi:LytTR family DNA-binding domain-containing protein [Listeria seeligeri]|uniref:LytTR family DNA-binding domain-containing protein n=1 Tax=Listeria seeligeri TaxID=1640 RepID=UPI0022EBACDF|nr:LytTR family DNA-binding domain-containing protein [Listeria seeligeri]